MGKSRTLRMQASQAWVSEHFYWSVGSCDGVFIVQNTTTVVVAITIYLMNLIEFILPVALQLCSSCF